MDAWGLIAAAALMGLAGAPHCTAMCGAPCAAVLRRCATASSAAPTFHLGRVAGYAAAGALAASSVSLLREGLAWAPWLRPLWILLHLAALALGLRMLGSGRLPAWANGVRPGVAPAAPAQAGGWQRMQGPVRAGAAGAAWIAWPCGLSQAALLLAVLATGPGTGAAAMAAFAIASSPGLLMLPMVLRRLNGAGASARAATWPVRAAGAALVLASGWAVGHGAWQQVAAWCAS